MKVISVFQTADGKQFASKAEAQRHEAELETLAGLRTLLQNAINSELTRRGNIDNVLRNIIMEAGAIRNLLQTHSKKMPKVQPESPAQAA